MKQHTIIFVPHARAKFRKWRLSTMQAGLALGALVLLTAGGLISAFAHFTNSFDREQLDRVVDENRSLREINQTFEQSVQDLESQLADYQDRIHKLAIVAGLPELSPSGDSGIGGSEPVEGDLYQQLMSLENQIGQLGTGMNLVQRKLESRRILISGTPAIAPVRGILSSGFGFRSDPFTKRRAFHNGVDYVAPPGKDVIATGDGLVVHAGRADGLGIAVYLSHGYGITTRYGHLSKVNVAVGERVERGEVIGFVGSTGRSTGYHVHYEVRLDGKPTNPLGYILEDPS